MSFKAIEYMESLTEAGFDQKQAKAMANGIEVLAETRLVTKEHLRSEVKGLENRLIKWMITVALATIAVIFAVVHFRIETVEQRIALVEQRIVTVEQKVVAVEQKIENIDQRITMLEKSIEQNRELIQQNHLLIQKLIDYQIQAQGR